MHPLLFKPIYKSSIWGGSALKTMLKRGMEWTSESWEVSDRTEDQCLVEQGDFIGRSLNDLVNRYPEKLLGKNKSFPQFPLLIKLINAQKNLSIQVHPDDETVNYVGGEPKTEAWYVLKANPDSKIYVGWNQHVSKDTIYHAIHQKTLPDLLCSYSVKAGDMVFLPGGLVHAIGEGCVIYEVQQNSNTTFRLYDWDRLGKDGKPRALHIEQAMKVVERSCIHSPFIKATQGIFCSLFQFREIVASEYQQQETMDFLFPIDGAMTLYTNSQSWTVPQYRTVALPAKTPSIESIQPASTKCLLVRLPQDL